MIALRLNPIVVKELRQGLKSKSFLVCFLGLQALMVLSMSIYFMNANSPHGGLQGAEGFFWTMIGLALLFFMPMRAFFGIYNEIRANTLELLFLTHMQSMQISSGKWMAQTVQVFMLISSILPYFVLRYLIGTINIVRDFQVLGIMVMVSLVLLSVGTGLSAWKSKLLRFFVIGGTVFMLFTVPNMLIMMAFGGFGGMTRFPVNPLTVVLLAIILILIFLQQGASMIAPPAENHARPKRILGLLLFSILFFTGLFQRSEPWLIASIAAMFPYYLGALSQPVSTIPTLYKRQRYPAFLHAFLLPGWPSAFLPILGMLALPILVLHDLSPGNHAYPHLFPILFGILFFPVALLELLKIRPGRWLTMFMIVNLSIVLLGVVFMITAEIQRATLGSNPMLPLLNLLPFTALFQLSESSRLSLTLNWIPAGFTGVLLLIVSPRPLRFMRETTRIARAPAEADAQ